jgi:hypothetical protein
VAGLLQEETNIKLDDIAGLLAAGCAAHGDTGPTRHLTRGGDSYKAAFK